MSIAKLPYFIKIEQATNKNKIKPRMKIEMETRVEKEQVRPNIRIQIQNENMDVDESENEEGEIIEDDVSKSGQDVASENIDVVQQVDKSIFTTGINIFDEEEQKKLRERAKRFALKPEEIHNFTDADLEELYESLGITSENDSDVRFDAVHMLGINGLNAEDILEYFSKYAPSGIEWIDEDSCNVTWIENITAARAMFYVSKAVRGMPAREPVDAFPKEFLDDIDEPEEGTGQSILLKNRQVEIKVDEAVLSNKVNFKNAVDMEEIKIPIPPGYWRLGEKHPKSKCLLMRFSLKTDKKPIQTESLGKYYKKLSSKNIISDRKKQEIRGIFERNKDLNQDKNPWGSLAKNWDKDAKFREREPNHVDEPKLEIKNPSLLVRLGKKKPSSGIEGTETEQPEEDEKASEKKTKIKLPRMRMYADEEEEKLRRKKLIQTIKKQTEKLSREDKRERDLRNVLTATNYVPPTEVVDLVEDDLGKKLKNRSKQMIFTVERDDATLDRKENVKSDIRALLDERRTRSPMLRRRISPPPRSIERRRSPEYRTRSPPRRYTSPSRRRHSRDRYRPPSHRPERTLHSDRIRVGRKRLHSDTSDDDKYNQKPRSKVAVVVKTLKKPAVASTIWSRVQRNSESESSSASDSESSESESSSSSASDSDSESGESSSSDKDRKRVDRPGFDNSEVSKIAKRSPLKITMNNDRFRR